MSQHSVAEAKNKLSNLIDRALDGEDVVITRHGHPVVSIRAIRETARPVSAAALDLLATRRVKRRKLSEDSVSLVRRLRDEI